MAPEITSSVAPGTSRHFLPGLGGPGTGIWGLHLFSKSSWRSQSFTWESDLEALDPGSASHWLCPPPQVLLEGSPHPCFALDEAS